MGRVTLGSRIIKWIEKYCLVPEGKLVGKPVKLTPHQKKWIKAIYDTPTRTFILSMPRKNAKTTFSAFLLLVHLCGPVSRANSQLYSAAQSRDQAAILFELAAKMIRQSPALDSALRIKDTVKEIHCDELGSMYKALSADAKTAFGRSPVFTVHDELGQVRGPRSDLYEALESASGAQESPLSIIISTQAPTDADLLSVLIDDARQDNDPEVKCVLYSAPKDAPAFEMATIKDANPHLHHFMNKNELARMAKEAQRMPSMEAAYRNLNLNQRVNAHAPFVSPEVWKENGQMPEELDGRTVIGGLDLSSRVDLTALVLVERKSDQSVNVWSFFWVPEQGLADKAAKDRVPYDQWANQGFIRTTPGKTVDYEYVAADIAAISNQCRIETIAYDRWRIDMMRKEFERVGLTIPLIEYGQGYRSMSVALDILEADLLNGRLCHGMNPVLTMCAANAVPDTDPAGNRKLNKAKTSGRIDGMVALSMAIATAPEEAPAYEVYFGT